MSLAELYERDFYAWTQENARLMREGRIDEVDVPHLVAELDKLYAAQIVEIEMRLVPLIGYLLKWQYRPVDRQDEWRIVILRTRVDLRRTLSKEKSLVPKLPAMVEHIYPYAVGLAGSAMSNTIYDFPPECPYSVEQILDEEFWP